MNSQVVCTENALLNNRPIFEERPTNLSLCVLCVYGVCFIYLTDFATSFFCRNNVIYTEIHFYIILLRIEFSQA